MKTFLAILLALLVLDSYGQDPYSFSSVPMADLINIEELIALPFPWPNKRCCNHHNIIALDNSGSMNGLSWNKAGSYLSSIWGASQYISFFTHGGTWFGGVDDYYVHQINAPYIFPTLAAPYGDTTYDEALIRAMNILSMGFPDRTCITFISDGWEQVMNVPYANIISMFLYTKLKFQKKTGCQVCLRCIITKNPWKKVYPINTDVKYIRFYDLCKQIGATITEYESIGIQYVDAYIRQSTVKLEGKAADVTYNGDQPTKP